MGCMHGCEGGRSNVVETQPNMVMVVNRQRGHGSVVRDGDCGALKVESKDPKERSIKPLERRGKSGRDWVGKDNILQLVRGAEGGSGVAV